MRNKYEGTCYKCGEIVKPGEGFFERHHQGWRVQHAACIERESSFIPFGEVFGSDEFEAQNQ
jgi:hypothetical protein